MHSWRLVQKSPIDVSMLINWVSPWNIVSTNISIQIQCLGNTQANYMHGNGTSSEVSIQATARIFMEFRCKSSQRRFVSSKQMGTILSLHTWNLCTCCTNIYPIRSFCGRSADAQEQRCTRTKMHKHRALHAFDVDRPQCKGLALCTRLVPSELGSVRI